MIQLFSSLKEAQAKLALQSRSTKDAALGEVSKVINKNRKEILAANALDVEKARSGGMKDSLLDRLLLNEKRIDSIIEGLETVIGQEDPIGRIKAGWRTPSGLLIEQMAVPLGVIAIIYESRPNVTADAFSLAYKAGCAILLRGSSAALESNKALVKAIKQGLEAGGGIPGAVELAASGSRGEVDEILAARGLIDAVLPRGGKDLIRHVVDNARVPVIETGEGNCHIYVEPSADIPNAVDIIENAKLQKPGACNAVETVLVHRSALSVLMPALAARLTGKAELRCDAGARAAIGTPPQGLILKDATESDWETEFLDYILAVKTVDSLDEAINHINKYGTRHSEAILTNDLKAADEFCHRVDAACVYTNASTRFTDGGEFGFGAELGISTQKFHARGPMGLEALTTIKYRISGSGQIRT
ncbi:glutamate-5-semialdehyde dehydrogenase [Leadbettera azotonutricia]|uniref:Gamma-glutamyl phosphate reductase n=1 Tax=Leadbettera azotonutricia (strain ATCC BAA-888 / DSM 13862 / ZAS-9) TaxID=545695 RepID=F5YD38_LEAAZ|nr:glutamate-5-semialdehyde dehydrogenase [Leadbettera azotonutricia]AEF80690.1 glutamate-5-semialdehyde dehydrogenase [Leadbettera azotonutricia ZAS-9]